MLFFSSCITLVAPEFRKLDNFEVTSLRPKPNYKLDLVMFNPNKIGARISELQVSVTVFESMMSIHTKDVARVKPNSDFSISLNGEADYDQVGKILTQGIKSFFGGKTNVPFKVTGFVAVKKFIFKKKVYFDFSSEYDLSKIKLPK